MVTKVGWRFLDGGVTLQTLLLGASVALITGSFVKRKGSFLAFQEPAQPAFVQINRLPRPRNLFFQIVTAANLQFGLILNGAIFLDGSGGLLFYSLMMGDFPLALGLILFLTAFYLLFKTLLNLVQAWLDPEMR